LDSLGLGNLSRNPNDNKQARLLSLVTIGDKHIGVDPGRKEAVASKSQQVNSVSRDVRKTNRVMKRRRQTTKCYPQPFIMKTAIMGLSIAMIMRMSVSRS
jgi:hypothetical protein